MAKERTILLAQRDPYRMLLMRAAFREAGLEETLQVVRSIEEAVCYLKGRGAFAERRKFGVPAVVLVEVDFRSDGSADAVRKLRRRAKVMGIALVMLASGFAACPMEYSDEDEVATEYLLARPDDFSELVTKIRLIGEVVLSGNDRGRKGVSAGRFLSRLPRALLARLRGWGCGSHSPERLQQQQGTTGLEEASGVLEQADAGSEVSAERLASDKAPLNVWPRAHLRRVGYVRNRVPSG